MSHRHSAKFITFVLALAASCPSLAGTSSVIPMDETAKALYALMGIANELIPDSSSCQGYYPSGGKAAVKDMLAMEVAMMYRGKNNIQGHCKSDRCVISITHARGEDVSSADIRFNLVNGKASIDSLESIITP